jgi:hypothetical protein
MSDRSKKKGKRYGHWFRMYDEILDDPKVIALPEHLCWTWVKVLAVARRYGGVLPPFAEIAIVLRLPEKEAQKRISALIKAGLIDEIDGPGGGALTPHGWEDRQYDSDVSTVRVRAFRQRERNADETFHNGQTKRFKVVGGNGISSASVSESESVSEFEGDNSGRVGRVGSTAPKLDDWEL